MSNVKNYVSRLWSYRYLFCGFLMMLVFSQFLLQYKELVWPKLYLLIALIAGILVLLFSKLNDPKAISRNTFVVIAFLGTANSLILPVRQNLDENTHYYHALQVADGKLRNQTDEKNFLMVSPDFLAITKMPSKPEYQSPLNTNLYSQDFLELDSIPAQYDEEWLYPDNFNNPAYIPSALGIKLGRAISDKLFVSYYMGRIFNLLFYGLLAFLAVKISSRFKEHLFLMATVPYALWITAGYNYDSLYYGIILLVFAQFTNFLGESKSVTVPKLLLYELTCLLLVFCKPPMIILASLPLFLPSKSFSFRYPRIKTIFIGGMIAVAGLVWILQGTLLDKLNLVTHNPDIVNSVDANANRMSYFIENPSYTVGIIFRTVSDIVASIVDSIQNPRPYFMSNQTMGLINLFTIFVGFLTSFILFKTQVTKTVKAILSVIIICITIAVIYAISGDTRVFEIGDLTVAGVQGRYHYYLLVALPLLLSDKLRAGYEKVGISLEWFDYGKATVFLMKILVLLNFLNTAIAVFGYL